MAATASVCGCRARRRSLRDVRSAVRIANASGYWGDDPEALARQVRGGEIDYVTLDFLAEITMVILQRQRERNPELGYAHDFVRMLEPVLPEIVSRGVRVLANAGGVNVPACAARIAAACRTRHLTPTLASVHGDDLMPRLDELLAAGVTLAHMDEGRPLAPIRDRVVSANAYLGAWPIAEALREGAQIVVTGRVTDAALTLGPLVHEHGWAWDDWDRLAAGIVAGHVLECGAQATGGNVTDWKGVPPLDVGYPIAEVAADGSFAVTKHAGTGGRVSRSTVTEQLLYEIGDPAAYLTPDVVTDFRGLEVVASGTDRVTVTGAHGRPSPDQLKVTIVYKDGFRATGLALISGPDVVAKAERMAEMLWHRIGTDFVDRRAELVGYRSCWGRSAPDVEPNEGILRVAVRDHDRKKIERFSLAMMGFALQGPPGLGVFGGRPDVQEAYGYWPTLVPRELVAPRLEILRGEERSVRELAPVAPSQKRPDAGARKAPPIAAVAGGPTRRVPLRRIAFTRSGDKGDHANIGVAARSPAAFAFLREALPASKVRERFADLVRGDVERFELPGLGAFNFVLRHALGGGGTLSLRVDHQGKTLGQGLLGLELDVPEGVLAATAEDGEG
ncbi:MAG TPA: acyclic terpene utilization AtuA family protein [Candidatus Eisenbacteria bacterium]|nr:acyclic terpene utilization AtuA family protein [Candidatus Eisenbacteria bacterium]